MVIIQRVLKVGEDIRPSERTVTKLSGMPSETKPGDIVLLEDISKTNCHSHVLSMLDLGKLMSLK